MDEITHVINKTIIMDLRLTEFLLLTFSLFLVGEVLGLF